MRRRWHKKAKEEADYQRKMRKSAGLFGIDGDQALAIEAVELLDCITVTQGSGFYPRTFSGGFTAPNPVVRGATESRTVPPVVLHLNSDNHSERK